ncbi:MAG: DUF2075 domain-containing protein [Planctomycetes bacterium]|nr:DUF2075 domain-containing protein [Planctomycetota bacterium]
MKNAGWDSDLPRFRATPSGTIRVALEEFVRGVSAAQIRAWDDSIPLLQREAGELLNVDPRAQGYGAILEYRLFYDERRADVILLAGSAVVVLELKGKARASQADLDQAAAYARDLRAYHAECHERDVTAVVVPTHASDAVVRRDGVFVVGPSGLDTLVATLARDARGDVLTLPRFLEPDAYCPLPTLVQAARQLFESRQVREIWRARAATEPAVEAISRIAHEAARTRTRHLVFVTGRPGAGKTLVGMRVVHAPFLDDLAVPRRRGKPAVPALYLSGNGPLVKVIQHELRGAGGGGRTFVRHIKDYLERYVPHPERVPEEHLLVFDEAQRAFDADLIAHQHKDWRPELVRSQPELIVDVAERMPEWGVIVALVGTGQEIHVGEERGLGQWREALEREMRAPWVVHASATIEDVFAGSSIETRWLPCLQLDTQLRFHFSGRLHDIVQRVLGERLAPAVAVAETSDAKRDDGLRLWATRDLEVAKRYLRERYADDPTARFGMLASSRDKALAAFGIANDFQATKKIRIGPWFCDGEDKPGSCRHLDRTVTEFYVQGLELDMALVCWGTDFVRNCGAWDITRAPHYKAKGRARPRDPLRMRINAYRVLLTRGRDGSVVFVPPLAELDETWRHLLLCGFRELRDA